jgi:hypothetical protein
MLRFFMARWAKGGVATKDAGQGSMPGGSRFRYNPAIFLAKAANCLLAPARFVARPPSVRHTGKARGTIEHNAARYAMLPGTTAAAATFQGTQFVSCQPFFQGFQTDFFHL